MSRASSSVRVSASHSVSSATASTWQALPTPFVLGPLDYLVPPFIPIAAIFVYESTADTAELVSFARLHHALARLLDHYPHLTGRLSINPNDHTPEITRLGAGVELVAATCSEHLATFNPTPSGHLSMLDLPQGGNDLLPPYDASPDGVCRDPLLSIQHTTFACGAVALAVRVRHCLCDAGGFFQLVSDLAELYRGEGADGQSARTGLAVPPCFRSFMSELCGETISEEARRDALAFQPSSMFLEPPSSAASVHPADLAPAAPTLVVTPAPTTGRVLYYSASSLALLKTEATSATPGSWVSTFEAVSAHLYQRVHVARLRLRALSPTNPSSLPLDFLTPASLRAFLALAPHYFPNALSTLSTTLPNLATASLPSLATAVHELTHAPPVLTSDTARWIAAQPDKSLIRDRFRYSEWSLMLSSWAKFDMYAGARFETEPSLVGTPFTAISTLDGLGYLLPDGRGEGGLALYLALKDPVWAVLEEDEEYGRYATG